jgi:hypothetical protein
MDLGFASQRRGGEPRMKKNALRGRRGCLCVRAVKAAGWAFIGAKRRALTEGADGSSAGFSQEGHLWENRLETIAPESVLDEGNRTANNDG